MEFREFVFQTGAISAAIWVVFQVVKLALKLQDAYTRFLPLVAVVVGVIVTFVVLEAREADYNWAQAVLYGVMNGASASGLQELQRSGTGAVRTFTTTAWGTLGILFHRVA